MYIKFYDSWPENLPEHSFRLINFWKNLTKHNNQTIPPIEQVLTATLQDGFEKNYLSESSGDDNLVILWSGLILDEFVGKDIAGKNIFDLMPPDVAELEKNFYSNLKNTPCGGLLVRSTLKQSGERLTYRTIQLPLADGAGNIRYFVGTGEVPKGINGEPVNFDLLSTEEFGYIDLGYGIPTDI